MSGVAGADAGGDRARCAGGSTPACGRSRSSSCRRRWRFSRSATWSPARCFRPAASATATRSTSGRILAGSAVGLLASTLGRLYSSTYYALRDTRTPLRYAIVRVALTTVLGYLFAIPLPRLLGIAPEWGAAGLTASAGIAGWVEMLLLRSTLNARIGRTGLPAPVCRAALGIGDRRRRGRVGREARAAAAAPDRDGRRSCSDLYGLVFLALTLVLRIPEASRRTGTRAPPLIPHP